MAKRGPKPIAIDADQLHKLAAMHCTMKEMAAFFDCSVDTLERNYADVISKGREQGKIKLRRLQWQSAEKGIYAMQIFLGKNLLNQSDKIETENKNTNTDTTDREIIEAFKAALKAKNDRS